jgi:hypothetical protein
VSERRGQALSRPVSVRGAALRRTRASREALLLPLVLVAAAAAISGFTALRALDPYDEGQLLLAARRISQGEWPYADFIFPYGPGHPLLLSGLEKVLGPSLLWWRIVRVAADAVVALLVFVLAQPGGPNPFPVALAFGLAAFAVATAAPPRPGASAWRRPMAAGALVALAGFWRVDFGAFAAAAVLVALALAPASLEDRVRAVGAFVLAGVGLGVVLYAPFAIVAGPDTLYERMVADAVRYKSYWTLPFPLEFAGGLRGWPPRALAEDLKDLIGFYVPLALLVGLAAGACVAFARGAREGPPWRCAGLVAFGLGAATYMHSRPDEFHTQPLLVVLAVLLTASAVWLARERRGLGGRLLLALTVVVLGLVALHGSANRLSALFLPPELERVGLPVTDGVRVRPDEADVLRRVVPYVKAKVPSGEPIFVAPRRSDLVRFDNLLFYILADRDTVLDAGATLQARPAEQRRTIAAIERERPRIVVRWTDPLSSQREPNRRGRPSGSRVLDAYLARAYRRVATFGVYRVLRRRPSDRMS